MNEEMTFGGAVDWIGKDKSRVVQSNTGANFLRFNKKEERFEASTDAKEWVADNNMSLNFGILWRPYVAPKPKSVIEEAIDDIVAPYKQKISGEVVVNLSSSHITRQVRRIVNLTLDEAKKACIDKMSNVDTLKRDLPIAIDALKVTL